MTLDQTPLSILRHADRVPANGPVNCDPMADILKTRNYTGPVNGMGQVSEPCVVIDRFGKIILWYLPNIVSSRLVVCG